MDSCETYLTAGERRGNGHWISHTFWQKFDGIEKQATIRVVADRKKKRKTKSDMPKYKLLGKLEKVKKTWTHLGAEGNKSTEKGI